MKERTYLTRAEAADYISATGAPIKKSTLQKFVTVGGGPTYRKFGNRAIYAISDLDNWLNEKTSLTMTSSSVVA